VGFFREERDGAVLITRAQQSRQEELRSRTRRYALTMTIRTLAFVVAVAIPVPAGVKIGLIAAAVCLPWLAVTAANAGPVRQKGTPAYDRRAPHEGGEPLRLTGPRVIEGEAVRRDSDPAA